MPAPSGVRLRTLQRPAGLMAVLDDVCATMHGQSEGADQKFIQVSFGRAWSRRPQDWRRAQCAPHASRCGSETVPRAQKADGSVGGHAHFNAMSNAFMIKHYAGNVRDPRRARVLRRRPEN